MTRETEGDAERDRPRYQRGLFDSVARLYAATRPGYPQELVEFVAATAGVGAGDTVPARPVQRPWGDPATFPGIPVPNGPDLDRNAHDRPA